LVLAFFKKTIGDESANVKSKNDWLKIFPLESFPHWKMRNSRTMIMKIKPLEHIGWLQERLREG